MRFILLIFLKKNLLKIALLVIKLITAMDVVYIFIILIIVWMRDIRNLLVVPSMIHLVRKELILRVMGTILVRRFPMIILSHVHVLMMIFWGNIVLFPLGHF